MSEKLVEPRPSILHGDPQPHLQRAVRVSVVEKDTGRTSMLCSVGSALHHQYEVAEQARKALRDQTPVLDEEKSGQKKADKAMIAAKQRYLESFADWLGHKAFCQDCKPKS